MPLPALTRFFRPGPTSRGLLIGAGLLLTGLGAAHECWLGPRRYQVLVGTYQYVARSVGEGFVAEPWEPSSRRVRQILHLAPGRATDLTAALTMGDTLRSILAFTRAGTNVVALRSTESLITLEGAKFNEFLRTDGLTGVLAQRTARNELTKPGREGFSRCLKTLVRVGDGRRPGTRPDPADTCWRQTLGLPLELVPEQDPYALRPGDSLSVRVLVGGHPAVGMLVQLWARTVPRGPVVPTRLHSDMRGRIRFRLPRAAEVMVSCVRMTPHPAPDSADWQSTWASLTFGGDTH